MPWCHNCKTEYEKSKICADCGAPLLSYPPKLPPENWKYSASDLSDMPWPGDTEGEPVKPAFLTSVASDMSGEVTISLLKAYGVPVLRMYPQSGRLVRVLFGFSGAGIDLYVPETMTDLAKDILKGEIVEEDSMDNQYRTEYGKWLSGDALSDSEYAELELINNDDDEIKSRFFAPLDFGTAGLRGILGAGINRMNIHVVRQATQGFASLILSMGGNAAQRGVCIAYDCRNMSPEFAREAACVMAGNGIHTRLFDALRPTPELSFAIREYGAIAGINITASHNPKEYNGYKVYWEDGAQLPPQHAAAVSGAIAEIDIFDGIKTMAYDDAAAAGLIELIGAETDEKFLARVMDCAINPDAVKAAGDKFKVVYTPFHGAGHKLVPEALRRLGVKHIITVVEQMVIDGNFPTVKSPNPEDPEGFYLAERLARETGAGLIIGTDPDADRVGVMVRNSAGDYECLTGNQVGILLLDYIIEARRNAGTLPLSAATLKTIVTTAMAREVALKNGIASYDTFTGFKFMAELMKEFEQSGKHRVIFSFEESYGYLIGDFVRDKDAVTATMLIAEMAAWYSLKDWTLLDALAALYKKYGYFMENTINLVMPGLDGLEKMKTLMEKLRDAPPKAIAGTSVATVKDYLSGELRDASGNISAMELKGSNVLCFVLSDGTEFLVRPSGTEPKIKVYILTRGADSADCAAKIKGYSAFAKALNN